MACCGLAVACGVVKDQPDAGPMIDAPLTCESDESVCSNRCVNTQNDPLHCGTCSPCALENATAGCVQGVCVVATCTIGFCDSNGSGGCEAQPNFQTDPMNCGGCGIVCGNGACVAGGCARRAFVLSSGVSANMGGLTGADTLCQSDAAASSLGGMWKAWLADGTGSPATRFTQTGRFVRVDRTTIIADDWADLVDGTIDNAVLTQANGVTPPIGLCWTNVAAGGAVASTTGSCMNWTSTLSSGPLGNRGQHNTATSSWMGAGAQNCDPALIPGARLYCFEQ